MEQEVVIFLWIASVGLSIAVLISYFFLCVNVDKIARKVGAKCNNAPYWEAVLWAKIGDKQKAVELFNTYISGKVIKQANEERQEDEEHNKLAKTLRSQFHKFYRDYDIPEEYRLNIPDTVNENN